MSASESEVGMTPSSYECTVTVLLVDDQMMVAEAIRRALRNEPNMNFHYCGDPTAAVAVAREMRPTVILQDLVMPGVEGLELVRQYRAESATSAGCRNRTVCRMP